MTFGCSGALWSCGAALRARMRSLSGVVAAAAQARGVTLMSADGSLSDSLSRRQHRALLTDGCERPAMVLAAIRGTGLVIRLGSGPGVMSSGASVGSGNIRGQAEPYVRSWR